MRVAQDSIHIETHGTGSHDVTAQVQRVVDASRVRTGVCTVFIRHTSASLVVQENADPSVRSDLQRWLERLAPESTDAYEHDSEGPDDMPAHLRAAITHTSETIPVRDGRLALGTWQAIYVWEHRRRAHRRELIVTVIGE